MMSAFLLRADAFTPSASAIWMSCVLSLDSRTDCSSACAVTMTSFPVGGPCLGGGELRTEITTSVSSRRHGSAVVRTCIRSVSPDRWTPPSRRPARRSCRTFRSEYESGRTRCDPGIPRCTHCIRAAPPVATPSSNRCAADLLRRARGSPTGRTIAPQGARSAGGGCARRDRTGRRGERAASVGDLSPARPHPGTSPGARSRA